jgi:hypothetical protein
MCLASLLYLLLGSVGAARRRRPRSQNPIKLLFERLDFDQEYGCYSFVDCGLFGFASKLWGIARSVSFRRAFSSTKSLSPYRG